MDGAVHTYKARLVAKGYTQTPGIDYEETFSPVADIRAIRILIAIAAYYDYEIWQMDVKTAFLNEYLNVEVYMEQPEGFVNPKYPNQVCKLKRSIYGLKQASRQWNKRFDDEIKKFGFSQNADEPCVYLKASGSNVTFLILYVDDILIMGNNIPMLQDVKSYLGRCFAMKDLGEAAYILGIKIYRDRSRRLIGLCQSAYIEKILKRFHMENSKRGSIPMQDKLRLSKSQGASTPAELKRMQSVPYASAVGSIMYAVRCTRPDVAFAQNITSRFQQNPGDLHWTTVKNILKYLRNTKDMFLVYGGDLKRELRVSCYTDAGYLTDADDLKSQTGYVFVLNGGAVDWKSAKQSIFATSFAKAEYIVAFDASKDAVWVRKFISRLGVVPTIEKPINMYCDNTGVIAIANESRITKGARHFRAKVHYLREVIEFGDIKLEKVHTDDNLVDPFTKALAFLKHSMRMEQYLTFTDHALWEVIVNGDSVTPVALASGATEGHIHPKTAEQKLARKNELKEKRTLMLAILDEHVLKFHAFISQEDANLKLLRSLPSAWNNIVLIMRNKFDLDILTMDDLYNNLRVFESKIKGQSSSNSNSQNVAFVSLDNTTQYIMKQLVCHYVCYGSSQGQASLLNYVDECLVLSLLINLIVHISNKDLEQIDTDDLEEMDLKRQMAMLTIRECKAPRNQGNKNGENTRKVVPVETPTNALIVTDRMGYDWSYQAKEGPTDFALMAHLSLGSSSSLNSDTEYDQQREVLNKDNLEIIGYQLGLDTLEARIVIHKKNEAVYEERISFLKYDVQVKDISIKEIKNQLEKALKEKDDLTLKLERFETSSKKPTKMLNSQISANDKTGLGYNGQMNESVLNNLHVNKCEVLNKVDSVFDSSESDEDDNHVNDRFKKGEGYHAVPPPYTRNYMPPRADLSFVVLDDSIFKSKVNETTASVLKTETNASKTSKDSLEKPKTVRNTTVEHEYKAEKPRKISQSSRGNKRKWNGLMTQRLGDGFEFQKKTYFGKATGQMEVRPVWNNVQKGNPQYALQDQGIFNRGALGIDGNSLPYRLFKEIDGGFELKFNLFSISQMCDKKNIVLFTTTECLVLSPDFKLLDKSQVFLKVPRQNNMYNFDLKNVVPSRGLTCLFAKAIIDESNLWHRRLGHIKFNTMNKLVKGNLVR
ncbi:retrotransposon protein, putative, ty1-copia subclass, partial [Tanacetum coccineum]